MCTYINELQTAIIQLAAEQDTFDMLQIRDRTRQIAGPTVDVRFLPCKFEALTFFERGHLPGFVLSTKIIEQETNTPQMNDNGQFQLEEDGALVSETIKRSVFTFRKTADIIHEALAPQHGNNN